MYSQKWIVISKTELLCSVSQFLHSYICDRFIYIQDRSAYSAARKYVDRSWEYINPSQTHEGGNWDWGREISRKRIHKWDFPRIVYQVQSNKVQRRILAKVFHRLGFYTFSHLFTQHVRGEIQMIPESAYKSSASKNWEILWKNKL